ncbi:MAG TPA: transglutaminase, partial [Desulfuromonas sp.]|nr:transglutaminase [Desulfuromonas sp.]
MTTGGKRFGKGLRGTALVVALFFTWTLAGGATAAHAAQLAANEPAKRGNEAHAPSAEERLEGLVREIEGELSAPAGDDKVRRQKLKTKRGEIDSVDAEIRRELAATRKKLKDAKLPAAILQRHEAFVRHYENNVAELQGELDEIEGATTPAASETAREKLRQHREKTKAPSRHQPLDPNNLPHRSAEPTKRQPRLKKEEFERAYGKDLASLPRAVRVAALGDLTGITLPGNDTATVDLGQPSIEDLAGTVDAPMTPAIEAKALELGHDPLKIYNWVRNNIEFVPTWGSIQGAQLTLETRQGNAFDTASLLVALLRASGVHARYVMGTVVLPIGKIQNWAGGFTDPLAALDFMSSGGIPTTALLEGGKVTQARFEHVWVEAWIDYFPSRGARHQNGQGEMWIPLDASFKQYAYTQGLDLQSAVPFDAQTFVDQLKATATINEAQGYATGVNGQLVQQTLSDYQGRVEAYIAQQHPNATVGDVLGKKEIVAQNHPYLLGTLPYKTAVRGGAYALLPASLRHTLSFNVTASTYDTTPLTFKQSLPELAGKKITLSFTPATPADEAVINAYLPQPHTDGTPLQPEELPTSLPAYLIQVKPELRIDGQVVATGTPVTLGANETFTMNFASPWIASDLVTNPITAGAYHAVALDLGRISQEQGQVLKARLETTKAKLEAQNFTGLTKDELVGDLLYTTALMYHAELGLTRTIAAKTAKVASVTWPSETIFKTDLNVDTVFGLPRSVSAGGLAMDADRLASVTTPLDGDNQKKINYLLQTGMISSVLEHSVPEQLISTQDGRAEGVGAVKALKIANEQGIPIYTVTKANLATVLPQLQLDTHVKLDIQNAVNAGKIVTVSKTNINFHSWVGCGYVIIDPSTGAGAYMIGGGLSGGVTYALWLLGNILLHILAFAGVVALSTLLVLCIAYGASVIFPVMSNFIVLASEIVTEA